MDFQRAWTLQLSVRENLLSSQNDPGRLLLLSHPPTFTVGRRDSSGYFHKSESELKSMGYDIVPTDRGGLVTFHGPGQLVGYPVVHLGRIGKPNIPDYVSGLEEVMVRLCGEEGVEARRIDGMRGVFVGNDKIGAVGVHVSRQAATHGFALNIHTDLSHYRWITACGLADTGVTSLARLGVTLSVKDAATRTARIFEEVFRLSMAEDAGFVGEFSVDSSLPT